MEACKFLLENGADPYVKDQQGRQAVDRAIKKCYPQVADIVKVKEKFF